MKKDEGKERDDMNRDKKEEPEEEGVGNEFGLTRIDSKLAKMSVEEAVKKEGILPFNPVEIADDKTAENLGRQAGVVYGASTYAIYKAVTRDDLPVDKRIRLGIRGIRPLLGMALQGIDTYNKFNTIEEAILRGEDLETATAKARRTREYTPSALDVVRELEERLTKLEEENAAIKKNIEKSKKN